MLKLLKLQGSDKKAQKIWKIGLNKYEKVKTVLYY